MIKFILVLLFSLTLIACGDSSGGSNNTEVPGTDPPVIPPPPALTCSIATPEPLYVPDILGDPQLQAWQCSNDDMDHIQTNHTSRTPTYSQNYHCINGIGFFIEDYNLFEWWDAAYLNSYYTIMATKRSDEDCYRFFCSATGSSNVGHCESFVP